MTDNKSTEIFNQCLTNEQLTTYTKLELICDNFLESNYSDKSKDERYIHFLNDLFSQTEVTLNLDTTSFNKMEKELIRTFGGTYDTIEGNFLPQCDITTCIKKSSNSRWIDKFVEDKMSSGSIAPNIIGGRLLSSNKDPNSGLYKTILMTEVIWRYMHNKVRGTAYAR